MNVINVFPIGNLDKMQQKILDDIGNFEFGKWLGKGRFGRVCLAKENKTPSGILFAIKVRTMQNMLLTVGKKSFQIFLNQNQKDSFQINAGEKQV